MKYIKKQVTPQFFIDDTKELQDKIIKLLEKKKKKLIWDNDFKNKRALKKYILENEQNYLCCYCEAKVTWDNSHIEHIKPKDIDEDTLTFDYSNLSVSCNGECFNDKNQRLTCGHKKGANFDEDKFLNPTKIINIREYFIYTNNYYMGASSLDEIKAKYTLELLKLNTFNNYLPKSRETALKEFQKSVRVYSRKMKKDMNEIVQLLLNKENLAFISFLRFKYKDIL